MRHEIAYASLIVPFESISQEVGEEDEGMVREGEIGTEPAVAALAAGKVVEEEGRVSIGLVLHVLPYWDGRQWWDTGGGSRPRPHTTTGGSLGWNEEGGRDSNGKKGCHRGCTIHVDCAPQIVHPRWQPFLPLLSLPPSSFHPKLPPVVVCGRGLDPPLVSHHCRPSQ